MTHPLVVQLRFVRSEFERCLRGVPAEDAVKRLGPMNSISWMIGHLANQENFYWNIAGQGINAAPGLNDRVGTGKPASTPPLDEVWAIWKQVTKTADPFLDALATERLTTFFEFRGQPMRESIGTQLQRTMYHYWFHTGEAHAARQMLGHGQLPQFVGSMKNAEFGLGSAE